MQVEQNFMGVQGGYVTYRVNTQTSMPSYPRSGSAVRRRFRDFVVGPVPVCVFPYRRQPAAHRYLQVLGVLSGVQSLQECRACRKCMIACKAQAAHHLALYAVKCTVPPKCSYRLVAAGVGRPAEDDAPWLLHPPAAGEEPCRGPARQR